MPRYEFLAEHGLYAPNAPEDENLIDNVVEAKREYRFLHNATMRTKAQILATGLWKQSKNSLIKNGRPKSKKAFEIQGYPGLLKSKFSDTTILEPKFFLPDPEKILHPLPDESFLLEIKIKLLTPFYSRDDIVFYPHENPLRREWVFHWPYLSAAGVKGLLRWAWRMCHEDQLIEMEEFLFGPRKEDKDEDKRQQGCLYTYPLFWTGPVGLDVINPHSRENNTGTQPIKYEVVKKDAAGVLYFLVFNRTMKKGFIEKIIKPLLNAIDFLLNDTAISAKRTTGWGSVKILDAKFYLRGKFREEKEEKDDIYDREKRELWNKVVKDGKLLPLESEVFTRKILAKLSGISQKRVNKKREQAYARIQEEWEKYKQILEKKKQTNFIMARCINLDSNIQNWLEKILKINQKSIMEK